jgi:acid phosphatase
VTIFYVTNRAAALKVATRANLGKDGFPLESRMDTLYCQGEKPEWGPDKTTRRAEIARKFRILLLFGDDLNDFISGASDSVARRRELVEPYSDRWGKQWIVLPNPMYGSWEAALYRSIPNPTEEQKRELKHQSLKELTAGSSTDPGDDGRTR